jgi:lipopolysaccharide transport system ATP-binding protein
LQKSVGDAGFRGKCYDAIGEMSRKSAIIFVSHSMPMISKISSRVILMNSGKKEFFGEPPIAIEKYYDHFPTKISGELISRNDLKINDIIILNQTVELHKPLSLQLILECQKEFEKIELNFVFLSRELIPVGQFNSKFQGRLFDLKIGINKIDISVESIDLNPGVYLLSLAIEDTKDRTTLLWNQGIKEIKVESNNTNFGNAPYLMNAKWEY